MIFAYADPPYVGQAKRHYGNQPDYAGEVDHKELIEQLVDCFPDGWALSLQVNSLRQILNLCPDDVRVGAWVKPFCFWKPGFTATYAWEPVIWRGGRPRRRDRKSTRDWVSCNIYGTTKAERATGSIKGVKPEGFCFWLFSVLGMDPTDTLVDLYPGSGAVMQAWKKWKRQTCRTK